MRKREWGAALLNDLKFGENGVRQYQTETQTWTLIMRGRVGVALNQKWTKIWRDNGATVLRTGKEEDAKARVMAIDLKPRGPFKGIYLVSAYAPVFKGTNRIEREKFWKDVETLVEKRPEFRRTILGGDLNAEIGEAQTLGYEETLGSKGPSKRTMQGKDLLELCKQEGLFDAGSYTQQKVKSTWWHPRYGSRE